MKSEFDYVTTFPPLGHPDHHFNKYPDHPWLRTKEEIRNWVDENMFLLMSKEMKYDIHEDMTVIFYNEERIYVKRNKDVIPIQIKYIEDFQASYVGLKSLIGTPYKAVKMLCEDNLIESLEGLGPEVNLVYLENNNLKNFIGMPEKNKINQLDVFNNPIESWDGFKSCLYLVLWCKGWSQEIENLLLDSPNSLRSVGLHDAAKKVGFKWLDMDGSIFQKQYFDEDRDRYKSALLLNKDMVESIDAGRLNNTNKKRKI